jgi:hypothetical protein
MIAILGDTHFCARNASEEFHEYFFRFYTDFCDKFLSEQLQDRCVDVGADIEKITCLNDGLDVVLVDVVEEVRVESEKVFMELF